MKTELEIRDQLIELEFRGRFCPDFDQIRTLSIEEIDCMIIALKWVLSDD